MGRELRHRLRHADRRQRRGLPPPFALTAKLNKLTIKVDRPQLSPEDIKKLQAAMKEKAQVRLISVNDESRRE